MRYLPIPTFATRYQNFAALILVSLMILAVGGEASAKPEFFDVVKTTYTIKSDAKLAQKQCDLCHKGATNKNSLNFYGKNLLVAMEAAKSKKLTPENLKSLDTTDSDGDGFTNIAEFQNDTQPGDPKSAPAGKATTPVTTQEEPNFYGINLRALFLPKNAHHPVLTHFPIGLFVFSVLFDLAARQNRNGAMRSAAYFNLIGAAITSLFAVITGLLAWFIKFGGAPLKDVLLYHLILTVATTLMLFVLWGIRITKAKRSDDPPGTVYGVVAFITLLLITVAGHLGGILSGVVEH